MMKKQAITIGTFDGVHTGHQYLFRHLKRLAYKHLINPQVLYFPLPPKTLLSEHPEMTVLSSFDEKRALFNKYGIPSYPIDFESLKKKSPEEFFKILVEKYHMGAMLVGPDFAFGNNRQGDVKQLRQLCSTYKIPLEVVDFCKVSNHKISSSQIRKLVAQGDIPTANMLMGHPYELSGVVVRGQKLGRKLGFPTANLAIGPYKMLPLGVFAVLARVGQQKYKGFCNIGFRPTVNQNGAPQLPSVEVHLFNFSRVIYGYKVTVQFHQKLRDEIKFATTDALKAQLVKDKKQALRLLKDVKWQ